MTTRTQDGGAQARSEVEDTTSLRPEGAPRPRRTRDTIPDLSPGSLVGENYRVVRILGTGAMGIVILARDEVLERDVAIKVIRPELLEHDIARERFLVEARAMARVQHPNVVQVFSFGTLACVPYFVMEHVDGINLEQWLRARGGAASMGEGLGILRQLCAGVSAIHGSGEVHRDLKASNVLIGAGFQMKVADLGLARLLRDESRERRYNVSGTPAYMAPEVALGDDVLPHLWTRADVYSLAVIAYEVLTGCLPFDSDSVQETMQMHILEPPPAPSSRRSDLPAAVDEALLRGLAKEPRQRAESPEALLRDLSRALDPLAPLRPPRLLIADDDADLRALTARLLGKAFPGATVQCVSDGGAALLAATSHPPDLILTDLDMPELNGVGLTAALRGEPATERVPVLVMTGVGGPSDWRLLTQLGANGFLVKPFDTAQLVSTIEALLGRKAAWRPKRG